ncbi:hypothetical protein RBI94_02305 [Pseudomonas putida]|uniref:transposase n=1 Tax=Pseudomonas putida TaxID=303 RepID=UPI0007716EA9|nr:transposase [Pseudomonas putida]KWW13546.1 hypothetical protein AS889_17995 [Pseudomonas putida]MDQ2482852.1 hypothetical protein [Pseudomonas putida]
MARYTDEQKAAIIAEYKASGDGITVFCKKRDHKPAYQILKAWLDEAGDSGSKTTSRTGASLLAEFEAQERDDRNQRLLKFLENAVKDLEGQLAAAQGELRNHKVKMGLIEPSVEE